MHAPPTRPRRNGPRACLSPTRLVRFACALVALTACASSPRVEPPVAPRTAAPPAAVHAAPVAAVDAAAPAPATDPCYGGDVYRALGSPMSRRQTLVDARVGGEPRATAA